ncbi:chloride channel protein [Kingella negevensis]|uniref:chloride channel protein n=1 Tax=Kingella negevensis TaxID=1522312 RepID=UPI00050A0DBA|nr:chloride channel protein [Kingella negevensis]WII90394.1 chloride channel protein [Kingella negevensis]WII93867.1 chloride channel protein [Kingella negevensis]
MEKPDFSLKFVLALLCTGVLAGLVGIAFTHLLHAIQQFTFHGGLVAGEHVSFRELVQQAEPLRRLIALMLCGLVVGVGWFAIHRWGAPLMEIKNAVAQPEKNVPVKTTMAHTILQIITVGMGSPLGREVAPREMSVALATPLSGCLKLSLAQKRVVLACASGAGLAAVYNVPLAAAVFVLETLLLVWELPTLLAALITCGTAVLVVRVGLGDMVQYANIAPLVQANISAAMLVWALVAGVAIGLGVNAFAWCNGKLPKVSRTKPVIIVVAVLAFAAIGVLSMWFPEILGNGKAGNQMAFAERISWQGALGLLASKWAAVLLATVAGAYGGRITPSMMLGAMIAFASAVLWNVRLPEISLGAAAFVGATVFLGLAQNMRLTAIVFMLELSRLSTAYWLPMCLCMVVALGTQMVWAKLKA